MKRLKLFSAVVLICSIALFCFCVFYQFRTNDKVPPVIKMDQTTIKVSVNDGEDVLINGVTAIDRKDGDVSDSLVIDNISDFLEDGSRFVTIAAFDKDNNVAKAVREITYTDYERPKIDFIEPMRFLEGKTEYLDNVTVSDIIDGDISGLVRFADNTQIIADKAGEYQVEIQVKNSMGDVVYLPFTIEVLESQDYNAEPSIHLKHYVKYIKKGKTIDYKKNLESVFIGNREYKLVNGDEMDNTSIGRDCIHINDENVQYETPGVYEAEYSLTLDENMTGQEKVKGTVRLVVVVEE